MTLWAAAAATRRTYKGVKIAAKSTGHAAVIAKRQVGRSVVRVRGRGGGKTRGDPEGGSGHRDSLRRTNVYNQAKSHPYAWQRLKDSPDYEMALIARKMQIESDWLKAGVLTRGLDASAPGSPSRAKRTHTTSIHDAVLFQSGDDNFADDERDGNVSAEPSMSRQVSVGSIDGGVAVVQTATEVDLQSDTDAIGNDVVAVEVDKSDDEAAPGVTKPQGSEVGGWV